MAADVIDLSHRTSFGTKPYRASAALGSNESSLGASLKPLQGGSDVVNGEEKRVRSEWHCRSDVSAD